jgi:hypothetical protein
MSVVNLACTVVQSATENVIGRSGTKNADGTLTTDTLNAIQDEVNTELEKNLLQDKQGEGARASGAVWTPSADDDFSGPEGTLTGVLDLNLNGTIHSVITIVRVR